jgi:hypothetical protein
MKRNPTIILAMLLLIACSALLAGCGGIKEGHVTAKDFIKAHDENYDRRVYAGQDCNTYHHADGTSYQTCNDRYTYVPDTRRVPDEWKLTIESCTGKKDCKHNTVGVSQDTYDRAHDGDMYNSDSRKLTRQ